jgi:hypothetical protein
MEMARITISAPYVMVSMSQLMVFLECPFEALYCKVVSTAELDTLEAVDLPYEYTTSRNFPNRSVNMKIIHSYVSTIPVHGITCLGTKSAAAPRDKNTVRKHTNIEMIPKCFGTRHDGFTTPPPMGFEHP